MKKTFTLFSVSALFLMLLFPVSVKADTTLSFVYSSTGQDTHCDGSNTYSDKGIKDSDFRWSNNNKDYVKNVYDSGDNWTGVTSGYTACSRNTYSFYGSSCTLNLLINQLWDNVERSLPSITINGNTYYAAQATWGESNSETIVDNKFNFTDSRSTRNTPVTFVYNNVNPGTGDFDISVYFPNGDADKFLVKTLTITQNAATYAVTATASNGTVSGTGDFAENEEVTLTATPNENYIFTGWSSSDIIIAGASANPLVFTMPAKAVSVTASFSACSGSPVTVNVNDGNMGSATGGGSYCAGVQVDLEATPKSGYRFVNWSVTSESASLDNVYNASTHFTMSDPAAAVTVQANFEVDPCVSSLTLQVEDNYLPNGAVTGGNGFPSNITFKEKNTDSNYRNHSNGRGYVSTEESTWCELHIPVNISTAGNYKVMAHAGRRKNMKIRVYSTESGGDATVSYNSTTYYRKTEKLINDGNDADDFQNSDYTDVVALPVGVCLIGLFSEWSHAAWDQITITRTDGTAFCPNSITLQKSGDASAAASTAQVNSVNVTAAMQGALVTITAGAPSDANHYFVNWTSSDVTIASATSETTTFIMPANAVTITANYGEIITSAMTFAAGEGGSITSATAGGNAINSGDNVVSGTSVTLTAGANSNYVFINWTDNNNSDEVVSTNAAFTFSMPATATSYTANFAQIDNVISQGSETGSDKGNSGGGASIAESHIADFDAFGHNVVKLTYSGMSGGSAYCGWNIGKSGSYNSASSAGATGFGFYYKTEAADDAVAMWFDPNTGNHADQRGMQLPKTENVWKYVYIEHAVANGWNRDNIIIYINGDQEGKTTAHASGAIYIADIAATSITSKPDIANYHYTNNRGGAMQVNEYGTLCLPMAGTISGATLYSVAGKEESDNTYIVLDEEEGNTIVAGKPYITQSTATIYTVTMSGAHRAVQDGNGLVGTYETINPLTPYNESGPYNYVLNENAFKKAGDNVTVGAYRAYLNWDAVGAAPAQAPSARRIRMVIEGKEGQTGIETVTAMPKTTKVLIDGQLFIIREGKRYTLTGARAQ